MSEKDDVNVTIKSKKSMKRKEKNEVEKKHRHLDTYQKPFEKLTFAMT